MFLFLVLCGFHRSKFGGESPAKSVRTIKMEGSSGNTVPSIVVSVTVPNKEAGLCFFCFLRFCHTFAFEIDVIVLVRLHYKIQP